MTQHTAQPVTQHTAQPVTQHIAQPAAQPAAQPSTPPASQPLAARTRLDETIPCIAPLEATPSEPARKARHSEIHPGDVLAGRYAVTRILSRERGLLLEASHTSFAQRVAIRVISPAIAGDPKAVERFRREARILSQLESEHVARIIDVGTLDDGSLYLVREFLDGEGVSAHRRLPLERAIDLFLQICEAVAEAHSHGVVIRDLQPSHVFVTERRNGEPVAKLTDFGTCKVMRDPSAGGELSCTKLLGLSAAASPELVRQQSDLDQRADVWSLGCLLYELVAGASAFVGEGTALMLAIAKDEPLPPSSLRRDLDVPQDIDRIVFKALQKNRDLRFSRVYDLALALRPHASARGRLLIEQIARLAGVKVERLAVERAVGSAVERAAEIADEVNEPPMTMVRSVIPSDPSLPSLQMPAALPAPTPPSFASSTILPPASAQISTMPPPPRWQPWAQTPARRALPALAFALSAAAIAALVTVATLVTSPDPVAAQAGIALEVTPPPAEPAPTLAAERVPASVEDLREAPAEEASQHPSSQHPSSQHPSTQRPSAPGPIAERPQSLASRNRASSAPPRRKKRTKASAKPAAVAAPAGKGTLVAMAIGASCTFAIDGASRGTRSSVRTEIAAGTHTVSCQPVDGSTRTRTVTVKPGEAAVAVFKF